MSDYLLHRNSGYQKQNHKYIARKWVNGKWQYIYNKLQNGGSKKPGSIKTWNGRNVFNDGTDTGFATYNSKGERTSRVGVEKKDNGTKTFRIDLDNGTQKNYEKTTKIGKNFVVKYGADGDGTGYLEITKSSSGKKGKSFISKLIK